MRKNLCIVLILLICFEMIILTTVTYADDNENTTQPVDLQTQREDLQNQLNEANGELENVQSDLSENLQQIEKLDQKIEIAESQLEKQESKIIELKKSIAEIEEQLDIVSKKYNKQRKLFEKRMVAIYEAGETQYLDILLKSRSLSDFLSSYYIITQLVEIDNNLIEELGDKKQQIDLSRRKCSQN